MQQVQQHGPVRGTYGYRRAVAAALGITLLAVGVAGCGTARRPAELTSSAGGTTPAASRPSSPAVTAVPAHPSRLVRQALLRPDDLPKQFVREPDPAVTSPSTMHSDHPACSTALAGVNSAAATGSVLAGTADRASAYYTTGGQQPTLSHSVARFASGRLAAAAYAALTALPAKCSHWTETDGHGTTLTTTVAAQHLPDPSGGAEDAAFTIRLVATGGVSTDVRVQVAVQHRGRMLALLACTTGSAHQKPAPAPASLLSQVATRL